MVSSGTTDNFSRTLGRHLLQETDLSSNDSDLFLDDLVLE